jgi:hypothetical protein
VIDMLVEEVETMQFPQCFGTPVNPPGAKTGSNILSRRAKVKPREDGVDRLRTLARDVLRCEEHEDTTLTAMRLSPPSTTDKV